MTGFQSRDQIITEYLKNIDFINGDWNYKSIQRDLSNKLGEEPAINITYKKDVVLNELNSEATEIRRIDEIQIVYSPDLDYTIIQDGIDRRFKTLTFKIGS